MDGGYLHPGRRSMTNLSRSSSSAAYKKRNSVGVGLQKPQQDQFHVTNYRDQFNYAEQFKPVLWRRRCYHLRSPRPQVNLDRVIGLTANKNSQIDLDPKTGLIAYTAGCVVVLSGKSSQDTIINSSRKTITSLAFSRDGKYLAIGESGHQPAVRVFEVASKLQVSECHGHKFGVTCVAFSPNGKYLVSIGTQHDMVANVWNWKQNQKIASNKISSKVNGLAFSTAGNMFVTIGVRHVKYWFLDESKRKTTIQSKNETVPLLGRNGLLGDQKTNTFVDVACGKGSMYDSVYVLSQNGILCQLTDRQISKTVELKTIRAYCIQASESLLVVGCANGVIRIFDAHTLEYIQTLHRPHPLGVDVKTSTMAVSVDGDNSKFPDTLGITFSELDMTITVVYSDRSLYKWDISRLPQVGKIYSHLYHSSCIWSVDVFPELDLLPLGTFITCSSDDTIRFWNLNPTSFTELHHKKSPYNYELLDVIYTDPSLGSLCEQEYNSDKPDIYESRTGIKCITTSPDGRHLASGDLVGNVRIHDVCTASQIQIIEAHDGGVLCIEYSDFSTEERYLVSASRDRLIHIYDAANEYNHLQTLSDHSSSICAVKLIQYPDHMLMISCANDKSLLFRISSAETEKAFQLRQNLISKTTPHDMVVDSKKKQVATACQDRLIRLYNSQTCKFKKSYKGSNSEDGFLLKLTIDPTGTFLAASCSDKSIAIIDFTSGEIVSTLVGHSELITGLKFTNDCRHLISVSADGSNSEILTQPKPDVTLVDAKKKKLQQQDDFDEMTFVVSNRKLRHSHLPSWARNSGQPDNNVTRGRWDKSNSATGSERNGRLSTPITIAEQSQVTVASDEEEEEIDQEIFDANFTSSGKPDRPKLVLDNNNVEQISYKVLPTPDSVEYKSVSYEGLDDEEEFTVTNRHHTYNNEDEKSSTSEGTSHLTMDSEDFDMLNTPRSSITGTPVSVSHSAPSTPLSPNTQLMDILQQITANNSFNNRSGHIPANPAQNYLHSYNHSHWSATEHPYSTKDSQSSKDQPVKDQIVQDKASATPTVKSDVRLPGSKPAADQHSRRRKEAAGNTNGKPNGTVRTHDNLASPSSSTASLTSTEPSSATDDSFTEIDKLCNSLRENMLTAARLYKQVEHKDNSEKDYLVETLRDVCDTLHTMLPPTSQFEAVVHQTVYQFLSMNRQQSLLDKVKADSEHRNN